MPEKVFSDRMNVGQDVLDKHYDKRSEEGSVEHQGPRVRKDCTTFLAKVVITAVHDEDGEHRGFGTVTQDISDRAA